MVSDGKRKKALLQSVRPIVGENGMRQRCYQFITLRLDTHTHSDIQKYCKVELRKERLAGSSRLEMR